MFLLSLKLAKVTHGKTENGKIEDFRETCFWGGVGEKHAAEIFVLTRTRIFRNPKRISSPGFYGSYFNTRRKWEHNGKIIPKKFLVLKHLETRGRR